MAEIDDVQSDDELNQAAKDGTIREGTARIHLKLFPKYGFLIPEDPLYHGETIFFGLTAHVDASKKYIGDLREELYPDQRVKFMAVPVDRDGTVKWKALVVGPLPTDQQEVPRIIEEEGEEEGQSWLTCTVHPNLQQTHGFATPEGGNQYHDNVYFSLREATDGLEMAVTDLTSVFSPGERIKALVVAADSKFKAKYRALKVCKVSTSVDNATMNKNTETAVATPAEDCMLIEETDQSAVSWIYEVLKNKDKIKLTSLAGDLSRSPDVRSVVQPQKKSLKRFLAKYPRLFNIKEDVVCLAPNCPPISFKSGGWSDVKFVSDDFINLDKNWSSEDQDDSTSSVCTSEDTASASSPLPYSTQSLKSLADVSSLFTMSMLASIVKSQPEPMKMSEVFKMCQKQGWEGMQSVAMLSQVVSNNSKYFRQNEKGCVSVTTEGGMLSVVRVDSNSNSSKALGDLIDQALPSVSATGLPFVDTPLSEGTQGSLNHHSTASAFSIFSPLSPASTLPTPITSLRTPIMGYGTSAFNYAAASTGINRKAYMPVNTDFMDLTSTVQTHRPKPTSTVNEVDNLFPSSFILPTSGTSGMTGHSNGYIYHSDNEDSFEEKFKIPNTGTLLSHYTEEESQFLSVVARGICPNAVGGSEEVFKMLRKELEVLGITPTDADGGGSSGALSRHLLCLQLDVGKRPRAK